MSITVTGQLGEFFMSLLLGAALGLLYDAFRVIRLIFVHSRWAILLQDILFFLLAAGVSFTFALLASDGQMRIFVLVGELLGFIIYFFTIGTAVVKTAQAVIEVLKAVLRAVYRVTLQPILAALFGFTRAVGDSLANLVKKGTRRVKNSQKRLKDGKGLLYNQASLPSKRNTKRGKNGERHGGRTQKQKKAKPSAGQKPASSPAARLGHRLHLRRHHPAANRDPAE